MEKDALATFQFPKSNGLFVNFEDGKPVKMRVLTTDPVVALDKWGGTKFAFIVYNFTAGKAQILNRGASIAKEIQRLHQDDEWGGNIKKLDIKITASGSGKDTSYTVTPLPKAETLTTEQIKECQTINLDEKIEGGQRMSLYNPADYEEKTTQVDEVPDVSAEVDSGEPINLDDIPF